MCGEVVPTGRFMGKSDGAGMRKGGKVSISGANLRPREREIIRLLSETSLSAKEIADLLGISVRTVEKHTSNAYQQLGVHSRTELIIKSTK